MRISFASPSLLKTGAIVVGVKDDGGWVQEHPLAVGAVGLAGSWPVPPRGAVRLIVELGGDVVLLRAALVDLHDLADAPRVERSAKPARHLHQSRGARLRTITRSVSAGQVPLVRPTKLHLTSTASLHPKGQDGCMSAAPLAE